MREKAEKMEDARNPLRFLIIDDYPDDRTFVIRELDREFPDSVQKEIMDPRGLAEALRAGDFDVVITDYHLRWDNGLEILRKVKARYPDCPVIMLTGTGSEGIAVEAMKAGLDDYIIKKVEHFQRVPVTVLLALQRARERRERKQAEEALQKSEKRYRALIENQTDLVSSFSPDGEFIFVNDVFCQFFNRPKAELIGTNWQPLPVDNDLKSIQEKLMTLSPSNPAVLIENRVFSGKGDIHWMQFANKGSFDRHGNLEEILSVGRDITKRKQVEHKLQKSEEKYRLLIENATDAIFIVQDESVKFPNLKTEEITGYSAEEFAEISFANLIHPDDRDMVLDQHIGRLSEEAFSKIYNFRIINKAGEELWVQISNVLIDWEERPATLIFLRDITQQKELETQLHQAQKMESVGRLAGGVAHDFNNMLGVILGRAEMILMEMKPGDPYYADLEEICKAANRSTNLTRQLLAFARRQTVSPKVLDLNETIAGMHKMVRRLIGEDIEITWMQGVNLWPVKIDPSQIDQILANICINARDAIAGVGKISIETQNVTLDEAYCTDHAGFIPGIYTMLAVSDDGCGMDKETLKNLFEPFYTTKEVGTGTGLGLSTVYGIVKQNNGFINVYSEPGQGTTFKIYLPRTRETVEEKEEPVAKEIAKGTETVLLVEDEESILDLCKTVLDRYGYTVLVASTPEAALALAEKHESPIHLLITDVVMPEMNGKALKERIEKLEPEIRVLFMSGYTANVIMHRGILESEVHFLQKPFSVNSLAAKVREVLDQEK